MTEFLECDACTAKLSVHSPLLYKIENIGVCQTFGTMMEAHACSPECVEEIGRRISRKQHGLNPVVGKPAEPWPNYVIDYGESYGPEAEECDQVTIWGDLRSGGVGPLFDSAWEMEKMLKQSQGYSPPPDTRQRRGESGRRGGDVPSDSLVRRVSSILRRSRGV